MNQLLYYFLIFTSVLSTVMFLALAAWYIHVERRERTRNAQRRADIADIMILFQTMRDVIAQQKNLARDFNQELDRKMGLVKEVLAKSLEKNEKLYERQQDLQRELEEVRARIEGLQREASYLQQPAPAPRRAAPTPAPAPPVAPAHIVNTTPPTPAPPAPVEEERLAKTGLTDAPYSVWFGLDFDASPPAAVYAGDEDEELAATPQAPEDPEAARSAFRALLDLPTAPAPAARPGVNGAAANGAAAPVAVPLQQRVLEYSEAGMGVAEIARELGIGKGEVRLMLSLAKQKGP